MLFPSITFSLYFPNSPAILPPPTLYVYMYRNIYMDMFSSSRPRKPGHIIENQMDEYTRFFFIQFFYYFGCIFIDVFLNMCIIFI